MTFSVTAVRDALARNAGGTPLVGYDEQVASDILEFMSEGKLLMEICSEAGYPMPHTVRKWAIESPEFRKRFESALEMQAHMLFEEAIMTARTATKDDTNQARMLTDNLLKAAGKLLPKIYGDKSEQSTIVPIQIITNLGDGGAVTGVARGEYTVEVKDCDSST